MVTACYSKKGNFKDLQRDVIDEGLCLGCGSCVAACPSILKMKINPQGEYNPEIEMESCINCGLCYSVCPGNFIPLSRANENLVDHDQATRCLLGNFNKTYVASSTNLELKESATSGGIVSSILSYMLEQKLIDGAIVTEVDQKTWTVRPKIARSQSKIFSAKKSKYVSTPTNSVLKNAAGLEGKFALVGLPCQIHGFTNLSDKINGIDEKIALKIGIFCGSNLKTTALKFLLAKMGITDYASIVELEYRGGKYPGGFRIKLLNGKTIFIKRYYFNLLSLLYGLPRCLLCPDLTNELADISVGDVSIGDMKKPFGTLITRSERGESIVTKAKAAGFLQIRHIDPSAVVTSNFALLVSKKKGSQVRAIIRERNGLKNPSYLTTGESLKPTSSQIFFETTQSLLRGKVSLWFLRNLPLKLSLSYVRIVSLFTSHVSTLVY